MLCTTFVISKHLFKQNNSSSWAPNEPIYICIWTAVAYKYQSEIFFYFQFLSKLYRRGFLRWLETSTQPLALGKDSKWILFLRQRNLIILMLKSGCNRNQSHPLDMVAGVILNGLNSGLQRLDCDFECDLPCLCNLYGFCFGFSQYDIVQFHILVNSVQVSGFKFFKNIRFRIKRMWKNSQQKEWNS